MRLALVIFFFFATTFSVYGGSLGNEFVSWDDSFLIVENPIVASMNAETVKQAFTSYDPELYIPITFLSYQIDQLIGGGDPFLFHLTNLTLHTLNALLVAWLLFMLLKNGWLALALGLVFAVHPLNAEAVLWASARKDVLSTFFFLCSILAYIVVSKKNNRKLFIASIGLFVLGLLSKVMVVTLPVVLLLVDEMRGRTRNRSMLLDKIPYIFFAVIFGVIAIFGKTKILVSSTLWQKILMATKSSVFYIQKFLWPDNLSVVYPYTKSIEFGSVDFLFPFIGTIGIVSTIAFLWNRKRSVSIGILFFLITLAPTFINFAKGGDLYFASDRYAYIPMIGLLIIVGEIIKEYLERAHTVASIAFRHRVVIAGFACVLLLLSTLSFRQSYVWRDSISLYEHALSLYPNARAMHNNLGMEQMLTADLDESIVSFNRALALSPDPKTKVNLAAAFVRKNRLSDAEKIYREILRDDLEFAEAEYGLGNIEQKRGSAVLAIQHYLKAIEIDPLYFNAYNNLGGVYLQQGAFASAVKILEKSIELKPEFIESSYNLALALIQLGQNERAEEILLKVAEINPNDADALAHLATLLYERKQVGAAAGYLQRSLSIDSSNPAAVDLVLRMKKDGYVR